MTGRHRLGIWMIGFSLVTTVVLFLIADVFNAAHLFNPNWPPHAKLHNAMHAVMLLIVATVSAVALARKPRSRASIGVAVLTAMSFWPGLILSPLIPGTSLYATEELRSLGFPINFVLSVVWIVLTASGWWLAARDLPPKSP